jgi:uncharacterized protein (DUF1330 family)
VKYARIRGVRDHEVVYLRCHKRIFDFLCRSKENAMNRSITMGAAMLAGAALGAAAVQTLHAQAKPPAYYVAEITVKDQDGYSKEFIPPATKALQEGGGKFLAGGGKTIALQGAPPAPRIVVIQFDNLDKAEAWWNSSAQKSAVTIGEKYATFRSYTVEGLSQ